ncbi:BREX-2 system adenine-specific DNA-methyltransferase PglX [Corynebacterium glutamicum]|uniref:BREX-2 system adenine-specific DNA-methyltransferase PglX n=1 Tax=Corynebacterium glutamicum TaxID=1718 RepID=UPI002647E175|nr:BREX-2 system adenine-specific DNA-methyltransferase PglX [Corynebacterium glutamicum]
MTLTTALQPVVTMVLDDMRSRLNSDEETTARWKADYEAARKAERVGGSFGDWCEDLLLQAAVGWVLTTVFVRFIEDNELFGPAGTFISGQTLQRRSAARDREQRFYAEHPHLNYLGYLEEVCEQLREVPATRGLVDDHAAIGLYSPSDDAARDLMDFWRQADEDGSAVWGFHDSELDTRFLGDLYENLSSYAQEKYALRQTPEFVEEFILDRTLTPALAERPLKGFKLIDPTCGSGHFLIGAFHRIFDRWTEEEPGLNARERAAKAMSAIHGVDINPFAVAITRFRLIVAFMKASQDKRLDAGLTEPDFKVLAGDTLLYGSSSSGQGEIAISTDVYSLPTEDQQELNTLLTPQTYDAVVGNPPYITVKDKALNKVYRERYKEYCKGTYALTVPFMVKFFRLAKGPNTDGPAGWVGQITSNSFMQREFGKPLIEKYFGQVDLREVIDSSGAYIPGHGTPTVIIVGRHSAPSRRKIIGVLGIQGEPGVPDIASEGQVWRSIIQNIDNPGFENNHVTVSELSREFVSSHPWKMQGGASSLVAEALDRGSTHELSSLVAGPIGGAIRAGADEAYIRPLRLNELKHTASFRPLILGENLRDFHFNPEVGILYPYEYGTGNVKGGDIVWDLWPYRSLLRARRTFQGNIEDAGLQWFEYMQHTWSTYTSALGITYAEISTHNHFVLDRGGNVFKQTAPVIKLPTDTTEDAHLQLLALLNSSTAAFWLKQNSFNKGSTTDSKGARTTLAPWENFFAFTGTTLKRFPLPAGDVTERGRRLDDLAQELAGWEPAAVFERSTPSVEVIDQAQAEYQRIRNLMIAEQEELDWAVYYLYGLTDADYSLPIGEVEGIELGTRAFEITLARRVAAGETTTAWFERHHSTPVTDLPDTWSDSYRNAVQERMDLAGVDKKIALLEQPEYKRRWQTDLWADKVTAALSDWLLTRLEEPGLWRDANGMPRPLSINQLAGVIETSEELADLRQVLSLWSSKRDATTAVMLADLLKDEAVPYLKGLRYKGKGVRKRAEWEATWEAQRREDAGELSADEVPVPPNYTSADMPTGVWRHRGKLDVPKERFISYPGAGSADDPSTVIGWAGWDHLEQGLAIMWLYQERVSEDAPREQLASILSGLQEQLPWIMQWHNELDPHTGLKLGDYLSGQLNNAANAIGVPVEDLDTYIPTTGRGRKGRTQS